MSNFFRLSAKGVECDETGLRLAGVPLLERAGAGPWRVRDETILRTELGAVYGLPVDIAAKVAGLTVVANALWDRNLATAHVAALLLQLPDPPANEPEMDRSRLTRDLAACGLLKAEDDWDDQHPRTGTAPNPGWFAPKPGGAEAVAPISRESAALTVGLARAASALASNLSPEALAGLANLAARASAASILFDAIFIPSANSIVDEGAVPGRPDMSYRWAHDETEITFRVLIDGQWRTLTVGEQKGDLFYDRDGEVIARIVSAAGQRPSLVTTTDALDRAAAKLRSDTSAAEAEDDNDPKLCPDKTKEPESTSSLNSIKYQEYASKLAYGWAINVGGVNFDGCDPATGTLLEAKADIDFMFDENDELKRFIYPEKDPALQMERQYNAALATGRFVVWHAQTLKGFRGLNNILNANNWPIISVIYDPN